MRPVRCLALVSQQDIDEQGRPELPTDGVFAVAEEVADFERLFDLFEEDLDAPARLVKRAHAAGGPGEVVGDEDHDDFFAVDGDEHFDAAKLDGVLFFAFGGFQGDEVIAQDLAGGLFQEFFANVVGHVVFGAGDPKDAALCEGEEVEEVDVGLVKQGDFARLESGAEGRGAGVIVMAGFFDDGAGGQEALEVQAEVELGGGLAAAVFGPVEVNLSDIQIMP